MDDHTIDHWPLLMHSATTIFNHQEFISSRVSCEELQRILYSVEPSTSGFDVQRVVCYFCSLSLFCINYDLFLGVPSLTAAVLPILRYVSASDCWEKAREFSASKVLIL